MKNRPRLVISNGTVANDGTGDTLYDATTKINHNFKMLWYDLYDQGIPGLIEDILDSALPELIDGVTAAPLIIDSDAPVEPGEGDLWLDKNVDAVKIYDGSVWFEFPVPTIAEQVLDASPSLGQSNDF